LVGGNTFKQKWLMLLKYHNYIVKQICIEIFHSHKETHCVLDISTQFESNLFVLNIIMVHICFGPITTTSCVYLNLGDVGLLTNM
jgi:hypothetical protein